MTAEEIQKQISTIGELRIGEDSNEKQDFKKLTQCVHDLAAHVASLQRDVEILKKPPTHP